MPDLNYYITIEAEVAGKIVMRKTVSGCEANLKARMISKIIAKQADKKNWAVFMIKSGRSYSNGLRDPAHCYQVIDKIIAQRKLVLPVRPPSRQRRK